MQNMKTIFAVLKQVNFNKK